MQGKKKIKSLLFTQPWKIFIFEAFLFLLTLSFGIVNALRLKTLLKIKEASISPVSFWQFIIYFILATSIILLIILLGNKFKKGKIILFKGIFVFAIIFGGLVSLSLWIPDIFALILMVILVFIWLQKPIVLVHNLAIILGIAGISTLGFSFSPENMILILIVFSAYDYIAVFKTKHMVKMAKEMIEAQAILGFILPQKISDFLANLKEVRLPAEQVGGKFLILGGGDVAFPLIFCVSLISSGILNSLIVAFYAFLGLFVNFLIFINQKARKPIPALPLIALFSIIGFFVTKLL